MYLVGDIPTQNAKVSELLQALLQRNRAGEKPVNIPLQLRFQPQAVKQQTSAR